MRKIAVGLAAVGMAGLLAGKSLATPPGFPISGSKHDFKTNAYVGNGGTVTGYNKCSTCHAAHNAKRVDPLWARADATTDSWIVFDHDVANAASKTGTGQSLNAAGLDLTKYLSAAELVASGTGLCMSCHDGQTAIATNNGVPVTMATASPANWGRDLSNMHPIGKVVPFGTAGWQTDVTAGNAASGSSVKVDTRGTVGCVSCHSMHSSSNSGKILRSGERCLSCHDR